MKKLLYALLLAAMTLPVACKKKEPDTCDVVQTAPPEFLDYWYFPKGSWWVYQLKDSIPAVYDTITVERASSYHLVPSETAGNDGGAYQPCIERYGADWKHSNSIFPINPNDPYIYIYTESHDSDWSIRTIHGFFYTDEHIFEYPYRVGSYINKGSFVVADSLDVTTAYGTFSNSKHMTPQKNPTSYHYHIARYVGIVKIKYAKEGEWELVNYHIAK